MLAIVASASVVGLKASPVSVEVDVSAHGLPYTKIVGLPARVVQESKERMRSAIRNSGVRITARKTTINLSPASLPKEQSYLDLPIALGVLQANQKIPPISKELLIVGELSLDGTLKRLKGATAIVQLALEKKFVGVVFPAANAEEVRGIRGVELLPAKSLREVIDHVMGKKLTPMDVKASVSARRGTPVFPVGNAQAKRALQIALAGNHHLLLHGLPGTGKTMIMNSIPCLLPALTADERVEVTAIYSSIGVLEQDAQLQFPPFRAPHHSASVHDLLGGGARLSPGEITLAHRGILFLDEMAEFPSRTLNTLRQPIEKGSIALNSKDQSVVYPSRFTLLAATNLCPCGNFGSKHAKCTCSAAELNRYRKKISGPLLDRIDMQVEMEEFTEKDVLYEDVSPTYTEYITRAKKIQQTRYKTATLHANGELTAATIQTFCRLEPSALQLLKTLSTQLNFSMRKYISAMRVAQTIADLDPKTPQQIQRHHVAEALQLCRGIEKT